MSTTKRSASALRFRNHDRLHAALTEIYGKEPTWEPVPGNEYGIRTLTPDNAIVSWFRPVGKTTLGGRGDLVALREALEPYAKRHRAEDPVRSTAITPNFKPRAVPNTVLILYRDLAPEAAELADVLRRDGLFPELVPVSGEDDLVALSQEWDRMRERVQFGFILCRRREWREDCFTGHAGMLVTQLSIQQVALLVRSKRGKSATADLDPIQEFVFKEDLFEVLREFSDFMYQRLDRDLQRHVKAVSDRRFRFMNLNQEVPPCYSDERLLAPPADDSPSREDEDHD